MRKRVANLVCHVRHFVQSKAKVGCLYQWSLFPWPFGSCESRFSDFALEHLGIELALSSFPSTFSWSRFGTPPTLDVVIQIQTTCIAHNKREENRG